AAVAIAMDCGEINFPITPPAVFAATNKGGLVPMILPAVTWIEANNELLFTTEPVMKTPIHPNIGDNKGNTAPAVATASPKTSNIPTYVMNLSIDKTSQIIAL